MRILVTGASGRLGSVLVPHLRTCGYFVIDSTRNTKSGIRVDLSNSEQVNTLLNEVVPELIINLAALTNVDECELDPEKAKLLNVDIVKNIAAWVKNNNCHLIHISTDQVYDGCGPHKEVDTSIANVYALTKYKGELAAASVSATVLRTNFFGPSPCEIGGTLSDWVIQSLTSGKSITVYDDILFSPIAIQHLVRMIETVVRMPYPGLFNLGSKNGMTKAGFAYAIALNFKLSTDNVSVGSSQTAGFTAYRPKDMRMDSSLFEKTFGVELLTLQEEIQSLGKFSGNMTNTITTDLEI